MTRIRFASCLALLILFASEQLWAADQGQEILDETSKARQEQKAKELKAKEQIEHLKREQQNIQSQQELDQLKLRVDPAEPRDDVVPYQAAGLTGSLGPAAFSLHGWTTDTHGTA